MERCPRNKRGGVALGAPQHRRGQKGSSVCSAAPRPTSCREPFLSAVCGSDSAAPWSLNTQGHHGDRGRDEAGAAAPGRSLRIRLPGHTAHTDAASGAALDAECSSSSRVGFQTES